MKIGFISLGCSKNLVDTEMMIGLFEKNQFEIVSQPSEAEILVVNTCGFIESAKKEAIDTILEMAEQKQNKCQYLIVTGCLVQRYKKELEKEIPEVDLWISVEEYPEFWNKITQLLRKSKKNKQLATLNLQDEHTQTQEQKNKEICSQLDYLNRKITTSGYYAYLKIAEGCSNHCTYCAIPKIRGPYISRKMEEILEEAQKLSDAGVEEIIVIAQDTTKYGIDLYGEPKLAELLKCLCRMNFRWIRFLYSYPETITDELIQTVKEESKICNYFDIPMQHVSNPVLKRMGRKSSGETIRNVVKKIREQIPEVVLRTTFITGFPGETEEQFEELKEFVKETKFDRLGVFPYSKEDGTPAVKLDGHMKMNIKKARANEIMKIQKEISYQNNQALIGKELEVLLEDITADGEYYIGRSTREVPDDTDGIVFVKNTNELIIGDFVKVIVEQALDYDLITRIKL